MLLTFRSQADINSCGAIIIIIAPPTSAIIICVLNFSGSQSDLSVLSGQSCFLIQLCLSWMTVKQKKTEK